jgi:hypothetical protein
MQTVMKKLGLVIVLLAIIALHGNAQDQSKSDSYPYWTISKDVQRMQYKDIKFVPAKITTGDLASNVSKGIQQVIARRSPQRTGDVTMTGYPSWTISKGVARMQYEKSNR